MRLKIILCAAIYLSSFIAYGDFNETSLMDVVKLEDKNKLLSYINDIKRNRNKDSDYKVLIKIWMRDKDIKDVNWNFLNNDVIRVNIADALVQGVKNQRIKLDAKPMYQYGLSLFDSKDIRVLSEAFMVVAHFDKKDDVILFDKFLYDSDINVFRSALSAVVTMCNSKVEGMLLRLANSSLSNKKSNAVSEIMQLRNNLIHSGYCE